MTRLANENSKFLTPAPTQPFSHRFVRSLIEGNYFYVFSACLMLLSCYLLMQSPTLINGSKFARTLKTLLLLQGYEILVIATAAIIFRKFGKMGDAFTLLIVELALLLDPTFFSNAFHTMPNVMKTPVHATWINSACLALAVLKTMLLIRLLRLPINYKAWTAFLLAASVVYLGEWPLNLLEGRLPLYDYFYYLGYAPLLLAFVYPSLNQIIKKQGGDSEYFTGWQEKWLPRILVVLPLFIVAAHYVESIQVYILQFFPRNFAPLLLAICILNIKNAKADGANEIRLLINDGLCLLGLLLSLSMANKPPAAGYDPSELDRSLIVNSNISLILFALAVVGQYLYSYKRLNNRSALYRIGILVALALIYLIHQFGVLEKGMNAGNAATQAVKNFLGNHPGILWSVLWIGVARVAYKYHTFFSWLVCGIYSMFMIVYFTPLNMEEWIPEMIQGGFLWLTYLYHKYPRKGKDEYTAALVVVLAALGRFVLDPAVWSASVVACEAILFVILGIKLKRIGYFWLGLFEGSMGVAYIEIYMPNILPPALLALAGAFILFATGVVITFRKTAFLNWFDRWAGVKNGTTQQEINSLENPPSPENQE